MEIVIAPAFENLIQPLSSQEFAQLENSVLDSGLLNPLVLWHLHNILLDGHHRLRICRKHGLPFMTTSLLFDTRDAARLWIIENQLGRRNLAHEQVAYLRGEQYRTSEKQPGARTDLVLAYPPTEGHHVVHSLSRDSDACLVRAESTSCHSDRRSVQDAATRPAAEELARKHGISPSTLIRDARFAGALNALGEVFGAQFRCEVLAGMSGLSPRDVIALAALPGEQLAALAASWKDVLVVLKAQLKQQKKAGSGALNSNPLGHPMEEQVSLLEKCRVQVAGASEALADGRQGRAVVAGEQDLANKTMASILVMLDRLKATNAYQGCRGRICHMGGVATE